MSKATPLHIVIAGYVGGINVGDEAIVGVVAAVARREYDAEITILSGNPEMSRDYLGAGDRFIKAGYPGPSLSFSGYRALHRALRGADLLLFAGGGLLQDVHSTKLLAHCAMLTTIARLWGTPAVAIGIGVGPIRSPDGLALCGRVLRDLQALSVRDEPSKQFLSATFPAWAGKVTALGDSIFLLGDKAPASESLSGRVGLAFRNWPGLEYGLLFQLVETLLRNGKQPVFLAYEASDRTLFERLQKDFDHKVAFADNGSLEATLHTVQQLDGVVSMRLHANLFALLQGVPFVALSYDEKVRQVIGGVGLEPQVLDLRADAATVLGRLDSFAPSPRVRQCVNAHRTANLNYLSALVAVHARAPRRTHLPSLSAVIADGYRTLLQPRLRRLAIGVNDAIGSLFPRQTKQWVKRLLHIEW